MSGIGASESAAVLGLSPYRSAMDVYLAKIGVESEPVENEYVYWGTRLEDDVRERFAEEHPEWRVTAGVEEFPPYGMVHREDKLYLFCSPDGVIQDHNAFMGLECKTASAHTAHKWPLPTQPGEVRVDYWVQCQHSMLVTGWDVWHLAVLIGGNQYREYVIEKDEAFCSGLEEKLTDFWRLVESRTPPPIDGSDASKRVLEKLYPVDTVIEEPATLNAEADALALLVLTASDTMNEAKAVRSEAQNRLRELMGTHAVGYTPQGYVISWKPVHKDAYSIKAQDYRVLRVMKGEA